MRPASISAAARTVLAASAAVFALVGFETPLAARSDDLPRGDRALIVGVDRYADPAFTDLRGAARDARNIGWLLTEHLGFGSDQIRLLIDEDATRGGIVAGIRDWLIAGSRPGARALLFFAGHGYFQPDEDGDEPDGYDEALVPHDARLESLETRPMQVANLLLDDEVRMLLQGLGDRQVHVIVDSCHAGTMTRSLVPPAADPSHVRTLGLGMVAPETRSVTRGTLSRSIAATRQREAGFVETQGNLAVWTAVLAAPARAGGPGGGGAAGRVHAPVRTRHRRAPGGSRR